MARKNHTTNLTELLLQCMAQPDPMLSMLEWLCSELMEAEVSQQLGAEKSERAGSRNGYRCGYRPRRLDTRMGTMYLMVPKVRQGGYILFFVTERKRSETALIQVVQEAFVQGVSTRKMEKLARSLGIENLSRSQVSEMTKGLNEQVEAFRNRSLAQHIYPVLWVDALYEKVRMDGRIVSMAVLVVCGVDEHGQRDILAVETYAGGVRGHLPAAVSRFTGAWPSYTSTDNLRCTFRPCGGNSQGFSRRKLAEVQSTLHAQHSGACAPQGEKCVCPAAESRLAGTYQRASLQTSRRAMPAV